MNGSRKKRVREQPMKEFEMKLIAIRAENIDQDKKLAEASKLTAKFIILGRKRKSNRIVEEGETENAA